MGGQKPGEGHVTGRHSIKEKNMTLLLHNWESLSRIYRYKYIVSFTSFFFLEWKDVIFLANSYRM